MYRYGTFYLLNINELSYICRVFQYSTRKVLERISLLSQISISLCVFIKYPEPIWVRTQP